MEDYPATILEFEERFATSDANTSLQLLLCPLAFGDVLNYPFIADDISPIILSYIPRDHLTP